MSDLKPCPFCGTAGERLIDLWDKFDAGHIAHVHCEKCGADGPSIYSEQDADTAIKRARWAWKVHQLGDHDPAERMTLPPVRNERHRYATRKEVLTVARAIAHPDARAMVLVAFYSGMRSGPMRAS